MLDYRERESEKRTPDMAARYLWQWDEDRIKGFEKAVKNNQAQLALEYASDIIDALVRTVDELQVRVETLEAAKPAVAKKAPAKAAEETADVAG
jgi:hypothetical protein